MQLGGFSADAADVEARLVRQIGSLPGIDSVDVLGTEPPDGTPRYTTVTVELDAARDDVLDAAERIPEIARSIGWPDPITLAEPAAVGGFDDVSTQSLWSLDVFPSDMDAATTRATMEDLLDAAEVEGVVGLTVIDGWPYASLLEPGDVDSRFDELRQTSLFSGGGSYHLLAEQPSLQFTEVAGLTSPELIHELVAITRDYPHAEVLLEGPDWPKLYIARVSDAEAATIDQRLRDPALAQGLNPSLGALPFQVTSVGADGSGYLEGEVGSAG